MTPEHRYLFTGLWFSWALFWLLAAFGARTSVRRESLGSRLTHMAPLFLAFLLLVLPTVAIPPLEARFLPPGTIWFWLGAAVTTAGLLFTAWARVHLGRNWSGTVTIKERHELITTGPYAWVRHPIYTGLLLAFLGSVFALGEWRGPVALLIAVPAFWHKLSLEEAWLREEFAGAYVEYAHRVPALVPRVRFH